MAHPLVEGLAVTHSWALSYQNVSPSKETAVTSGAFWAAGLAPVAPEEKMYHVIYNGSSCTS